MDEVADRNDDVGILMVIVSFLHIRREKVVTKLIRRDRGGLGDGGRRAKRNVGSQTRGCTWDGVHVDSHVFFCRKDFVQVVAVEVGMENESFGHDCNLHDSLLVVDGAGKALTNSA